MSASLFELKQVRGVCLDIDDTLSSNGKLTTEAYQALWDLKGAGLAVVAITGRPAGWCDHIARYWPLDAVVGENGAFTFYMEDGKRKRLATPGTSSDLAAVRAQIEGLERKVIERFPLARWASDQAYREYDLAIDFCEDVPAWPREDVDTLVALCEQAGAHAKISSIHVNAWFGSYDKCKGFDHWLESGAPGLAVQKRGALTRDEWLFIGDSPNDSPMFEHFKFTVGVANLRKFKDRLKHAPRWITSCESGEGFVEMARRMIAAKAMK